MLHHHAEHCLTKIKDLLSTHSDKVELLLIHQIEGVNFEVVAKVQLKPTFYIELKTLEGTPCEICIGFERLSINDAKLSVSHYFECNSDQLRRGSSEEEIKKASVSLGIKQLILAVSRMLLKDEEVAGATSRKELL